MPRLETINVENADAKTRELLDGVQAKLGMVPNLLSTLANSPAALEAYLGLSGALSKGALPTARSTRCCDSLASSSTSAAG
jgi:hypothetical protein